MVSKKKLEGYEKDIAALELANAGMRNERHNLMKTMKRTKQSQNEAVERFLVDFESINFVDPDHPLGKGATAIVFKASLFGQSVAVKAISSECEDRMEEIARLLCVSTRVSSRCILERIYIVCVTHSSTTTNV